MSGPKDLFHVLVRDAIRDMHRGPPLTDEQAIAFGQALADALSKAEGVIRADFFPEQMVINVTKEPKPMTWAPLRISIPKEGPTS